MIKNDIWTVEFWKRAGERALRTFCQALLASIGTGAIGITDIDWLGAASIGATAAVVSILTSIVLGIPEVDNNDSNSKGSGITRDITIAALIALAVGAACVTNPETAYAKTNDGYYEGVDLSHWDGGLDLVHFADDCNLDFAIIKCGGNEDAVGGRYRDSEFVNFYGQAQDAGLHTGAYYYTTTTSVDEAREDADHCADILDGYGVDLDMPVFIDIEDAGQTYLSQRELTDVCIAFCEEIVARGYKAGIYTSGSWWQGEVFADELDKYSDWVAWWGRSTWPEIDGIYSGLWQVGGITWGHDTYWDPDSYGDWHDYDLCRVEYWDTDPTPKPEPKPEPQPEPTPTPTPTTDARAIVTNLQEALGTVADGEIWGQYEPNREYVWGLDDAIIYDDTDGSPVVRALQDFVGADTDGYWGIETSRCTQKWLSTHGYDLGEYGIDGVFGTDSCAALAQALNDGAISGDEPAPEPEPQPEPTPAPEGQGTVEDVMNAAYSMLNYAAYDDPLPGSYFGRWLADLTGEDWLAGPSSEIWWCEMYVSWCLWTGNVEMEGSPTYNTNIAYNNGGWKYEVNPYDVQRGDIVQFDWDMVNGYGGDGVTDHVCIATGSFDGYGFPTIEGNVGNAVVEYYRDMSCVAHVLRPDYA